MAHLDDTYFLVERLRYLLTRPTKRRQLAVVLGAGMTSPNVPGVLQLTDQAERFANAITAVSDLDAGAESGAEAPDGVADQAEQNTQDKRIRAYALAIHQLHQLRGEEGVRAFVQRASLTAYRGDDAPQLDDLEPLDPAEFQRLVRSRAADWDIPDGLDSLATILREYHEFFHHHILTTNFDPLIEVALARARVAFLATAHPPDGAFESVRSNAQYVVTHLHGDAEGESLHEPSRLREARPTLERSITKVIRNCVLLVVGYSGWDDVLTRVLRREIALDHTSVEVLWSVYEDHTAHRLVNPRLAQFFEEYPGAVIPFHRVDRDRLFPQLVTVLHAGNGKVNRRPLETASATPFFKLTENLRSRYLFGQLGITKSTDPGFLFWPHRLREPHLIHGVHALAAMRMMQEGLAVELHVDDWGLPADRGDYLFAEFRRAVIGWFERCGVTPLPDIRRLSRVIPSDNDGLINAKAALWDIAAGLYASNNSAADVAIAVKVLDPDATRPSGSARRFLSPIYTWYSLEQALQRQEHRRGAVTLGGEDETRMWDKWRETRQQPDVCHLLVPRLGAPAAGGNLWDKRELRWDTVYGRKDLEGFIRSQAANLQANTGVLEWLFSAAHLLANEVRGVHGVPLKLGRKVLGSWDDFHQAMVNDPLEVSRILAQAIASWFYATPDVDSE